MVNFTIHCVTPTPTSPVRLVPFVSEQTNKEEFMVSKLLCRRVFVPTWYPLLDCCTNTAVSKVEAWSVRVRRLFQTHWYKVYRIRMRVRPVNSFVPNTRKADYVSKPHFHPYLQLSLNRESRRGTTDDFTTSSLHFSLFSTTPGTRRIPGLSIPWCCLPTSSSVCLIFFPPFHCALQDGFRLTWWMGDMSIPLQFASLYDGQEVFMWSDCLLNLRTDLLVVNMVFVRDA